MVGSSRAGRSLGNVRAVRQERCGTEELGRSTELPLGVGTFCRAVDAGWLERSAGNLARDAYTAFRLTLLATVPQ